MGVLGKYLSDWSAQRFRKVERLRTALQAEKFLREFQTFDPGLRQKVRTFVGKLAVPDSDLWRKSKSRSTIRFLIATGANLVFRNESSLLELRLRRLNFFALSLLMAISSQVVMFFNLSLLLMTLFGHFFAKFAEIYLF